VESLLTQGQIIAAAIAAQASADTDAINVDPDKLLEMQAGQSGSPTASATQPSDSHQSGTVAPLCCSG
jgi:two-component system sensor histidine kinase ChvG